MKRSSFYLITAVFFFFFFFFFKITGFLYFPLPLHKVHIKNVSLRCLVFLAYRRLNSHANEKFSPSRQFFFSTKEYFFKNLILFFFFFYFFLITAVNRAISSLFPLLETQTTRLETRCSILETLFSILETRYSILDTQCSRIEFRVTVNLHLTGTVY